jgi:hypothetical protein
MRANHWSAVFLLPAVLALGASKAAPRMLKARVTIEEVTEYKGVAILQVTGAKKVDRLWAHKEDVKVIDDDGKWIPFEELRNLVHRRATITYESTDRDRAYIIKLEK